MSKLSGKVALITGAGRGIGRAVALKLASEGARLVINDLDDGPLQETVRAARELGTEAVPLAGSVVESDFGDRFVDAALSAFGDVHIIVNNAGYTWDNVIQKTSDDQFRAMLDVHLVAPFRILRAAIRHIREAVKREQERGEVVHRKVVNVSSLAGLYGNAGQSGYAVGKSGIVGLTRTLCKEWGRYRVNVNCVAFGLIDTRLTAPLTESTSRIQVEGREVPVGIQPALLQTFRQVIPLGRSGTPEEAAGAVYLLCLPESDYISGQVLVCSGGLLM